MEQRMLDWLIEASSAPFSLGEGSAGGRCARET
jgi:hypothetical protein